MFLMEALGALGAQRLAAAEAELESMLAGGDTPKAVRLYKSAQGHHCG